MLKSTEHEISIVHLTLNNEKQMIFCASKLLDDVFEKQMIFCASKLLDCVFILLINIKMPTIDGILTFMCRVNFILS